MDDLKSKFAILVGLDWANKKHDVCVQIGDSDERNFEVISHTPEAIENWLKELHKQAKGNIAVAVESTKGPIVYALQKYSFVTVFPVHAVSIARYREAMFPSGAKDDPSDAELILDFMIKNPKKVKALRPSSDSSRTLALLVEQRRSLVDDRRRNTNRHIDALKCYQQCKTDPLPQLKSDPVVTHWYLFKGCHDFKRRTYENTDFASARTFTTSNS
jgi:hypothetical protein